MVFNVLARNRDDHTKNHAFLMGADGTWSPSPAYDLTLSEGPGGEHNLDVAGEGRRPGTSHFHKVAAKAGIAKATANALQEQVAAAIGRWTRHAEAAGLPEQRAMEVASLLGVP